MNREIRECISSQREPPDFLQFVMSDSVLANFAYLKVKIGTN